MSIEPLAGLSDAQELLLRRLAGLAGSPGTVSSPTDDERLPPLSPDQRRLWFLCELRPGRTDYNVAAAWRLRGPLCPADLDAALVEVVSKHAALRTVVVKDGELRQRVAEAPDSVLAEHDLASADDPSETAVRLATEESRRPFDLTTGPLYRFWLARLGPEDYVFGFAVHHLVFDRDSLTILLGDLTAAYKRVGSCTGAPAEPELQYADYARDQHPAATHKNGQGHRTYWRKQLEGITVLLDLPTDHERPQAMLSGKAGDVRVDFDSHGAVAIRELADECDTTPFVVCLAAFDAVLYRYTGATSFTVGCPFTARNRRELEPLIGFFTRSLPIATRRGPHGDPTFRRLVDEARNAVLEAHEHQAIPLEEIVSLVEPPRDTSYNPLFQVWFDYAVGDAEAVGWPEPLNAQPFEFGDAQTRFDLELHIMESAKGLVMRLLYAAELFEHDTAVAFLGHYHRLLGAAASAPDTALSRLPLLGEDQTETIINGWATAGGGQ